MDKSDYISQLLATRIANLEIENAALKADNQLLSQKVNELTPEDEQEKGDE